MRIALPVCLSFVAALGACTANRPSPMSAKTPEKPAYPATRSEPLVETLHGAAVSDPYRWLEDGKSAEVRTWAEAQDAVARTMLGAFPGRDALARRFRQLFYVDSISTPVRRAGRLFYMRTRPDLEKAMLVWRDGFDGAERVLLDPNRWSADGTVSLGTWVPSWDGRRIVFARKANAADEAELRVVEVDDGRELPEVIAGGKYAHPSWTPDNRSFYYEFAPTDPSIPVDKRPGHVELRLHVLGTDPAQDPVIHEPTGDPSTFLDASLSRDGKYLFVSIAHGWNSTDVWFRENTEPAKKGGFRPIVKGIEANHSIAAWQDRFYIASDEGASRSRVFRAEAAAPERERWTEIVPEDPEATLEDVRVIGGHLVLNYLRRASNELRVATLDGKPVRSVSLPSLGTLHGVGGNPDEEDFWFSFSSWTQPQQVWRTNVREAQTALWAKTNLPLDPSNYEIEQVLYPSRDGTQVSMFLVHRKGLPRDGNAPVLLNGYGGFNVSLTPVFRASIYPWIEAGGVYAVPNLRGGGEYGRAWHEAGRGKNKQNVFDDFIAAAEYLVREKWTRPQRLAISGGSNGGLLVGAAVTQRPDLFGAVVCAVPLLDMVRYHLFGSGRTWISEYGTAEKPEDFKTLHAYSPYHRVGAGKRYPPLLLLSADNDDRVDPMHARKFAAALQAASGAPVLLRVERNAGHGGADQVRRTIESSADQYAFLFATLGVQVPDAAP